MGPRTVREALIAELLGDVDRLLARVEALTALVAEADNRLTATAAALENAGDKYRLAVTAFTEQAKTDLAEYLDQRMERAASAARATLEEQRRALQEAARQTLGSAAPRKAADTAWADLAEHAVTALIAAACAAGLVYAIVRYSLPG